MIGSTAIDVHPAGSSGPIERRTLLVVVAALVFASCGGSAAPTNSPAGSIAPSLPAAVSVAPSVAPSNSPSPSVNPVPPARQIGLLTFMRADANGDSQTWTACPDLTQAKQLTAVQGRDSGWPVWSPDGSRIAIDSNRADPKLGDSVEINDIFTMKPDGTGLRKLTDSVGVSGDPAYSPDGKLIAFEADRGARPAKQGIYVMNAIDGSGVRRVTTVPPSASEDTTARFSPDGTQLVFTRKVDDSTAYLLIVHLDGSGLRQITSGELNPGDATWSPDGTQLVFEAYPPDSPYGSAWIVGSDGTGLRKVTNLFGATDGFADPVWSPDGTLILLLHGLFQNGAATVGLATIHPDGKDLSYVSDGKGEEHQPDWTGALGC